MLAPLPLLVVLLAGIGLAIQAPTNAALARSGGSVLLAAIVSFTVGLFALVAAWAMVDRTGPAALRHGAWWMWLGGFYGAFFVAAFAFAAPRLGLASALTIAVATQLATALVLDHYGLLGLPVAPVSPGRVAGVAIVLAGVVLVRRG